MNTNSKKQKNMKKLLSVVSAMTFIGVALLSQSCSAPAKSENPVAKDLQSKINDDLKALKADLDSLGNPGKQGFRTTTEDSVTAERKTCQDTTYSTNDSHYNSKSHWGYITLYDIVNMMVENPDNNTIALYPSVIKTWHNPAPGAHPQTDSVECVICRGAYLQPNAAAISFSPASHYYLASWCPQICPAQ